MVESFLTEDEVKGLIARLDATWAIGEKYKAKLMHPGNVMQFNTLDVIVALYSERLDKSSKRLNKLTLALIILTIILAILTGVSVWKLLFP
jgi:hypothetical protein